MPRYEDTAEISRKSKRKKSEEVTQFNGDMIIFASNQHRFTEQEMVELIPHIQTGSLDDIIDLYEICPKLSRSLLHHSMNNVEIKSKLFKELARHELFQAYNMHRTEYDIYEVMKSHNTENYNRVLEKYEYDCEDFSKIVMTIKHCLDSERCEFLIDYISHFDMFIHEDEVEDVTIKEILRHENRLLSY